MSESQGQDGARAESRWNERFPNLRPIRKAPTLWTINGFGFGLFGRRDADEESATFVRTHCFCVLFVPVVAIRAYRVAAGPGGAWIFFGAEPLSGFAAFSRLLVLALVLGAAGAAGWNAHVNSESSIARRRLDEARELVASGRLAEGAERFAQVAGEQPRFAGEAASGMQDLLAGPLLLAAPKEAAPALAVAARWVRKPLAGAAAIPDLEDLAEELAERHGGADAAGALALLDAVAPLAEDPKALAAKRRPLLEKLMAEQPGPDYASELARMHEAAGEPEKCAPLLAPYRGQLGAREGARILGLALAREGDFEGAGALLSPYVDARIGRLRDAESRYRSTVEAVQKRAIQELEAGAGPPEFYDRWQKADPVRQQALVEEHIGKVLDADSEARAAREALVEAAEVVPAAIELGMAALGRSRALADPDAKRRELERAEKTFLSIQGVAGESDQFRLSMGQVYYWLGKNAEGKQLFDELLAGRQRDFETLYAVAGALRNLGAATESRVLLEEAYEKGAEGAEKHRAAALRAITSTDVDDAVVWLRRADPKELQVQASLSDNLGQTALRRGADDEAAAHFRQAIAAYDKMPEHASKLNNGALSRFQLFAATGDRQAFAEAAAMLEKAAALSPGDSIVLFNSGTSLAEAAALDLLGDALDFKALKRRPTLDLLLFLCRDEGELSRQAERVRSHPGFAKAAAQLQRALVLAPRGVSGYAIASWMLFFGRDARGLKDLDERLGGLDLDLEESKKEALDGYLGRDDAKLEARFEAAIARHQRQIAEAGRPRDLAFAVNATGLADSSQSLSMLGRAVDLDPVIAILEEAHAATPSLKTRESLISAISHRAAIDLGRSQPTFQAFAGKHLRAAGAGRLLALALAKDPELRRAALAREDFQRALALLREGGKACPGRRDPWEWALFSAVDPEEALRAQADIRGAELASLYRRIAFQLAPFNVSLALDLYWERLLAGGDAAEGKRLLERCAATGAPVPPVK